ncbi:hypothetical protein [Pedobacter endophyticus]|uniref:BlaR1 peptidase M56 n=1 Tax=Pedobacter endophyticus TaxID=2789740 RepID=A0A7S9PYK0_9SPHI|nr:hypothetical protein [Pedobacter endophyticus]QPH39398.1 hypothetical protein IZT61_20540 [Pedobacter endophyticus]
MSWIYYLIETNLYLAIFYGFYRLFLCKETFYAINRYYLIATTAIAFVLPFFEVGFLKKPVPSVIAYIPTDGIDQIYFQAPQIEVHANEPTVTIAQVVTAIYL